MPTITAITAEVQSRCNALNNSSTIAEVIDCAIAARKVELAGGSITRTTLDAQIQRVNDLSGGSSAIEDLIALAAMQPAATSLSGGKTLKVQEFLTSGTWTRPAGVDSVEVLLVGGGGGGGYLSVATSSSG
ncbi:MAG: hypothetical protein E6R03_16340, partial [Hyphomicrobiaceae bacterium]